MAPAGGICTSAFLVVPKEAHSESVVWQALGPGAGGLPVHGPAHGSDLLAGDCWCPNSGMDRGTRHYSIQEAPPASKVVHALLIYMHAVKCEGLGPQKWLHALRLVGGPWVVRFIAR